QDQFFGTECAIALLVLTSHKRERLHDIVHVFPFYSIEMEECCIKFSPHREAPLLVPPKRRTIITKVFSERSEVTSGITEFQDSRFNPGMQQVPSSPQGTLVIGTRRDHRPLRDIAIGQVRARHLLPSRVIKYERR